MIEEPVREPLATAMVSRPTMPGNDLYAWVPGLVVLGRLAVGVVCVERLVRRTAVIGRVRVRVTGTDRLEDSMRVGVGLSVRAGELYTVETAGTRGETEGRLGVTVRVGVRETGDVTLDEVLDVVPDNRGTVVTEGGETVRVVG